MTPAAKLAEQMETIWFPIDGYELVCDVCGCFEPKLYVDQRYNIACAGCRERA